MPSQPISPFSNPLMTLLVLALASTHVGEWPTSSGVMCSPAHLALLHLSSILSMIPWFFLMALYLCNPLCLFLIFLPMHPPRKFLGRAATQPPKVQSAFLPLLHLVTSYEFISQRYDCGVSVINMWLICVSPLWHKYIILFSFIASHTKNAP